MGAHHFSGRTKARRAEEYYIFVLEHPLILRSPPPPTPHLKVSLLEDLNSSLVSVSAFRKMKTYTFVLGVITPCFSVFTLMIFLYH